MFAKGGPHQANANQLSSVHSECTGGCPANRSQTYDFGGIFAPCEVIGPLLLLGMKQRRILLSQRIRRALPNRFETVACWTSQAEVFELSLATGRTRLDVLKFKNGYSQIFWGTAIRTAVLKVRPDSTPKLNRNVNTHTSPPEPPGCASSYTWLLS